MNKTLRFAALAAALVLSACQTSGNNGIFGDAVPKGTDGATGNDVTAARSGENPNARRRLKNTQNALSDYCPAVRIRGGTESFRVYRGRDRENDDNVRYQARITKVARECTYVGENLEIRVGAKGRIIAGPAGGPGTFNMPIRVAVQQGGCSRHFDLHQFEGVVPSGATNSAFQFVDDAIVIPAPTSTNVRIYLGFDETPNAKSSTQACTS